MIPGDATSSFLRFLEIDSNSSTNTLKAYKSDIEHFFQYLGRTELSLVTPDDVVGYFSAARESKHYSESTFKRKLVSLRRFFAYLVQFDFCDASPMREIGLRFRSSAPLPRLIPLADLKRLLEAPILAQMNARGLTAGRNRSKRFKALRDSAILSLLFFTGMRVGEVTKLDIRDFDSRSGSLLVHGKGRKDRMLYVRNRRLVSNIHRYLELRLRLPGDEQALFLNRFGQRLTPRSIQGGFGAYLRIARVKGSFTPHSMRHTMATLLLEKGTDLRTLQTILGHSSILSTQIYTHVAARNVEEALCVLGKITLP
ncbi:MAG: tyrosine-type recombinase/integrase [Nitrososphaerales archaeon]|nr:tyrosine-type recombinase/integrase [Nitrososphaerales archaeon]